MSLNLLAPLALGLGVTLPIVVIFYLLKVRRHDEEVSSTFLWNDLVRDLAAHEPLQRLKWSLLLLLQLIALALITLAVARPFSQQEGQKPVQAVLLVDGSASMQAQDVQPTRFAKAVESARGTLAGLPENSLATAILVAAHPQVLVAATADRRQVDRALLDAQPSGAAADMREALLLARSLVGDPDARRIYLFTDGAFTLPADLPDDLGSVEVIPVGQATTSNLAVTTISTRPDPRDNRRQQLFTRVENFSDSPTQAHLALAIDGQVTEERDVPLAANGKEEQVFEELPAGARYASVAVGDRRGGGLTLDDTAYAVLVQRKPAQVLLVSNGNQFLEKVLTLLPNVDLYRIAAQRYLAVEADRFDIIVFDDYVPPLLPRGNLLIVNPPDRGPFRTTGEVRRPRVATWDREDPVLAFVDIRDLSVNRATKLDLPRWAKPLVSTADGIPLMASGQDGVGIDALCCCRSISANRTCRSYQPSRFSWRTSSGTSRRPAWSRRPRSRRAAPESLSPLPQVDRVRVSAPNDATVEFPDRPGPDHLCGHGCARAVSRPADRAGRPADRR